jgi:hypothetical protein
MRMAEFPFFRFDVSEFAVSCLELGQQKVSGAIVRMLSFPQFFGNRGWDRS